MALLLELDVARHVPMLMLNADVLSVHATVHTCTHPTQCQRQRQWNASTTHTQRTRAIQHNTTQCARANATHARARTHARGRACAAGSNGCSRDACAAAGVRRRMHTHASVRTHAYTRTELHGRQVFLREACRVPNAVLSLGWQVCAAGRVCVRSCVRAGRRACVRAGGRAYGRTPPGVGGWVGRCMPLCPHALVS